VPWVEPAAWGAEGCAGVAGKSGVELPWTIAFALSDSAFTSCTGGSVAQDATTMMTANRENRLRIGRSFIIRPLRTHQRKSMVSLSYIQVEIQGWLTETREPELEIFKFFPPAAGSLHFAFPLKIVILYYKTTQGG
jgi:hypothetical protein